MKYTVHVHFINGEERIVLAKDIKHVGEEGAQRGTALVDGREVPIYKRSEPEWGPLWYEQEQRPEEEDYEEEIEGDGSHLHQCPYCYNVVSEEHEEFCHLNPNRNREIMP